MWNYGILSMILFGITLSSLPTKIYNDFTVNRHEKMNTYISQKSYYDTKSSEMITALLNELNQGTSPTLLLPRVQQAIPTINGLYNEAVNLRAPRSFENHKATFIKIMDERKLITRILLMNIESNGSLQNELNNLIMDLRNSTAAERLELMKAFDEVGIEYSVFPDGSIEYWIKTYSPAQEEKRREKLLNEGL
jgi:hypothetical protein